MLFIVSAYKLQLLNSTVIGAMGAVFGVADETVFRRCYCNDAEIIRLLLEACYLIDAAR